MPKLALSQLRVRSQLRVGVLAVVLASGAAFPVSVLADDGAASGAAPAKPAQPKADAKKPAAKPDAKADANADAKSDAKADAQPSAVDAKAQAAKDAEMLGDFVHYVLIDRGDLAKSMGEGLLGRKFAGTDFAGLVDRSVGERRFVQAIGRAQQRADLEPTASELLRLYEAGKLAVSRDRDAISANIKLLTGTMSQRLFARARLLEAREYAVPQVFQAMQQSNDLPLSSEARQLLVEMGRHAVVPLSTALLSVQPQEKVQIARVLRDIGQGAALPYLAEAAAGASQPEVSTACAQAIQRITASGTAQPAGSLADQYVNLADLYSAGVPSLVSFPGEKNQLLWEYNPGIGLVFTQVDSRVWGSMMAMRLGERALKADPNSARAVSSWLAANFSREIKSPAGYVNPAWGADRREAMYYAVAAGPSAGQAVLARALDASDTPLARRALAAIERTAGGAGLWSGSAALGGRRPLLEAIKYPNRRVQYEAALALGAANPREGFEGSEQVVRLLSSAIRDAGSKFALVLATSTEQQGSYAEVLRQEGYTIIAQGSSLDAVGQQVADAPGVDLIVSNLPSEQTGALIAEVQSSARLRATPVLALVTAQGYQEQFPRYSRDARVRIAREGLGPKDVAVAAAQLVEGAAGGTVSAEEAAGYRDRALSTLRDIGLSNSPVYKIEDAQAPLLAALADAKDASRVRIALILSSIGTERAQRALVDAAVSATGPERSALLTAATASARRFGSLLDQRGVDSVVELARSATGDDATAAAALMGALNLPGNSIVPLITGK